MKKLLFLAFSLVLLESATLKAIDYAPWFERILVFEGRVGYEKQWHRTRLARNEFGLKVTPWTDIRAEIEFDCFSSRHVSYRPEAFKFSGQYRFFNDLVGDQYSVTAGATGIVPFSEAIHERALFYPGHVEVEFNGAIGQEDIPFLPGRDRGWIGGAVGFATQGSPWWRFNVDYMRSFCDFELGVFIRTLAGDQRRYFEYGFRGNLFIANYSDIFDGQLSLIFYQRPISHGMPRVCSLALEYTDSF